jgi:hypothetical protein
MLGGRVGEPCAREKASKGKVNTEGREAGELYAHNLGFGLSWPDKPHKLTLASTSSDFMIFNYVSSYV